LKIAVLRKGRASFVIIPAAAHAQRYAQINMDLRLELDSDDIGFLAMIAEAIQ
jgi:antitoxin component of MazEF toxin-antitoxin module